jgi:hypothetical protein
MCLLLVPDFLPFFLFFLLWLLTVLMKQTRQAVRTVKQSVLLRCLCMLLIGTFQYDPFVKEAFDEEIVLFSIVVFDVNNKKFQIIVLRIKENNSLALSQPRA